MKNNSDSDDCDDDDRKMPAKDVQPASGEGREVSEETNQASSAEVNIDSAASSAPQKLAAAAKPKEAPVKRKPSSTETKKPSKKGKASRLPTPKLDLQAHSLCPQDTLTLSGGRRSVKYIVKSSFAPDVIARAAGTEKHGRGKGPRHQDTEIPENETAEEKRLRRNRINERRKRARRAMKIDYLNEQYHNITAENERIREENQLLREQITDVRNGQVPRGILGNTGRGQDESNSGDTMGAAAAQPDPINSSIMLGGTSMLARLQESQPQAPPSSIQEPGLLRALAILQSTQQSNLRPEVESTHGPVLSQTRSLNSSTRSQLEDALAALLREVSQQSHGDNIQESMVSQQMGLTRRGINVQPYGNLLY